MPAEAMLLLRQTQASAPHGVIGRRDSNWYVPISWQLIARQLNAISPKIPDGPDLRAHT